MSLYAKDTTVSVSRSKQEIDSILTRYKTTKRGVIEEQGKATVVFERDNRAVRIEIFLPHPEAKEFRRVRNSYGREAGEPDAERHEKACRQRWRALGLVLKAKLEAVESGITSFETEFMAHLVVPGRGGQTIGKWLAPQLDTLYKHGKLPPLLTGGDE